MLKMPNFTNNFSPRQWKYFRQWIIVLIIVEVLMVCFHLHLFEIYWAIAIIFGCGFLLRLTKLYPGNDEPLILDLSAVCLAIGYAYFAQWLGANGWRFLLIFCSSGILILHFIYIAQERTDNSI